MVSDIMETIDIPLTPDERRKLEKKHDAVNSPSHYTDGSIECIDAIESSMNRMEFVGFLKGNVLKYIWRFEKKNQKEDLLKAQWYLNKLINKF